LGADPGATLTPNLLTETTLLKPTNLTQTNETQRNHTSQRIRDHTGALPLPTGTE